METRGYRNTDENISLLGFGCMRLPVKDGKEIDHPVAFEMIDHAIKNGVNYFDTAYPYHEGKSEPFVGEALAKYPRESFKLASKMPMWLLKTEEDVDRLFQEQLERCRVDYFDFYLMHGLNKDRMDTIEKFGVYEKLRKKQSQGFIRHLGFSFHDTPEVLENIVEKYDWDFAQIQLNYVDWELQMAKRQYEILRGKNIPVIVMEPVRGGALATLCEEALEIFKEADPDASPASWAIRYVASLPGVLAILSGMSDMSQLVDNLRTLNDFKPLRSPEYDIIAKVLSAYRRAFTIPCTNCRYCMDCPTGVDIPRTLAIYNSYLARKSVSMPYTGRLFGLEYSVLGEEHQAHHCVKCNKCAPLCPQGIEIPEWIGKVASLEKELQATA
jgi:predicted aldo/keto reductase-like oxidoreductase